MAMAAVFSLAACSEKYTEYEGPSYIGFSDTLNVCPVQQSGEAFDVMIASTRSCDHDRTFGVEVITGKTNAIMGYHYTIPDQTVTIPAGERSASLRIVGNYDNMEHTDSLSITLALVSAEDENWDLYGQQSRVLLQKVCPFDIHDFEGYCRVVSSFWMQYDNKNLTRIIKTEIDSEEDNTLIFKDFLMEGYDIKVRIDNSDILNPVFKAYDGQVMGDTRIPFNYIYGDGRLRAVFPAIDNQINMCSGIAYLYYTLYVEEVGTVGTFVNIMQWLTDEEVKEYENEQ